jgi:sugar transferase (PEP-CTERM/EpsH1 system associated)
MKESPDVAAGLPAGGAWPRHALILANRLPYPLDDGWKVRTFHVMRGVAGGMRATAIVFHPAGDQPTIEAAREALGSDIRLITIEPPPAYTLRNLVRGIVTRIPVHVWNQESVAMQRAIAEVLARDPVDVVVAESTFMARYLDRIPSEMARIVDTHNIDSLTFGRYVQSLREGPRRWYASATVRRLAGLEAETFRKSDGVWVCSDVDHELARSHAPADRVWTVPNGVDTAWFSPSAVPPAKTDPLLFFGRLDYFPNIDGQRYFTREILPHILARHPELRVSLVGAAATREISELVAQTPALRLAGRVPDVRAWLAGAAVVVVPLRVGGGTRLKILEALSMARPVVSTSVGAEGLAVRDREHLRIADSPEAFADAVLELIENPEQARQIGENGRALVQQRYDWSHVRRIVASSLESVLQRRGSR